MAAQISPRPTPVASQLLTPSKSGVTHSEPQKSTFQSELKNAAGRAQDNDKTSVKNSDKVAKNHEVVEKTDSDSVVNKNDSGVDDSVNSSNISAADTNAVRKNEQQSQNNDGQKADQITGNEEARVDSSLPLTDVDEGKELPQTGARLPLESQRTASDELGNRSLSTNEPLPSVSTPVASTISNTEFSADAKSKAELSLSEQRVLPGQATTGSSMVDQPLTSTVSDQPLSDNQSKTNINVANAAVTDVTVAKGTFQTANQSVVNDDVKRSTTLEQSAKATAGVSAINATTEPKPIASVSPETDVSKLEGQLSSQQLNKAPINEGATPNNQSADKTAQVENNVTRPTALVADTSEQRPIQDGSSAQASVSQITASTQIDEPKQSTAVQQNDPALLKAQSAQNQADVAINVAGQNQANSQSFESVLVNSEKTPTLNAVKEAALTVPSQAAVQMANISQEKLNQQQNSSRDFKLEAANNAALSSSEQAIVKDVVKTNIAADARVQINQPAPLPIPVNTTSLTDNQTFALNQSLEKMRSGIDINTLNTQADDASNVKSNVDKALVANEAVQQLSHLQNNLKTASPVQLQMPVATPPSAKNWGNAVADKVIIAASQNLRVANIQLDPPELGALQVRLQVTGPDQQMTVSFTSPHASVRDALEQNLPRLREMLEEQGINLGESSVNDQGKDGSDGSANGQHSSRYADQDEAATINPLNTQGSLALVDFYA